LSWWRASCHDHQAKERSRTSSFVDYDHVRLLNASKKKSPPIAAVMTLGDEGAHTLGIRVKRLRVEMFVATSL
jgi:hypothetical protein